MVEYFVGEVGGAVGIRVFEVVSAVAVIADGQALQGQRGSGDIAV